MVPPRDARLGALRGRFSRRLFVRFLLAAALPMAAIALLAVLQVRAVFSDQAHERLLRAGRNYGNELHSRLLLAQELLVQLGRTGVVRLPPERAADYPFAAVVLYPDSGARRPIYGDGALLPDSRADLGVDDVSSKPRVRVAGDGSARTLMALRLREGPAAGTALAAVLRPDYLWGRHDVWPYGIDFCVLAAASGRPLFCPEPDFAAAAQARRAVPSPARAWRFELAGEPMLAVQRDLFLPSAFAADSWRIVAAEPRALAVAPAQAFARLFPLAALLAVALAGWVGFRQSRWLSDPLQRLRRGVAAIAAGDFGARVRIDSADEFEELGQAFNRMAARIGRQVHAVELLAEADRSILASAALETVGEDLLRGLSSIVHSEWAGILLLEGGDGSRGRLIWRRAGADRVHLQPVVLAAAERALLEGAAGAIDLAAAPGPLPAFAQAGGAVAHAVALPVQHGGRLAAALLLGYCRPVAAEAEDLEHARAVADRLAVALAAASREHQLVHQANYDPLTDLPNRHYFMRRIEREFARAGREGPGFALLFIDLDRFKNVNDSVGHGTGDRLLQVAAARLQSAVGPTDTAARWGGDEFVVLAPAAGAATAATLAEKLIEQLSTPYRIDEQEHHVGASIGIALHPGDGRGPEQLLKNADVAMFRAKEAGRGCHAFFERSMDVAIQRRTLLEHELRIALEREQFLLVYQPLVRLEDGVVEGAEALLRWRHPRRGIVPPGEFIGVLEDSGLIGRAGQWVLRAACEQYRRGFGAAARPGRIAVNVSPRQFWFAGFPQMVRAVLAETGVPPQALELEITENVFVQDVERAIEIADELRALGVRFALDDFGTGHSSMSYLRRLPVDTIKIDRSFLFDVETDRQAAAILEAIIALGRTVGKTVVAEGVETAGQLQFLRERGCEIGQGFYFSRPVPPAEFGACLSRGTCPVSRELPN